MYFPADRRKTLANRAAVLIVLGIFLVVVAFYVVPLGILVTDRTTVNMGISLVGLAGLLCYFWGLGEYARSKGYTGWLFVLGLCNIIGLLILLLLPKQDKTGQAPSGGTGNSHTNYPRYKRPY